jgi:hypothetical protein
MKPPADVFERSIVDCERLRFEIDVAKDNLTRFDERQKPIPLSVDPRIAHRAPRIVPNGERSIFHSCSTRLAAQNDSFGRHSRR